MPTLEDFIENRQQNPLDSIVQPVEQKVDQQLTFLNKNMQRFFNSDQVQEMLHNSGDYERNLYRAQIIYKIAKMNRLDPKDVFNNYAQVEQHFFGSNNTVSNYQSLRNMYNTGQKEVAKSNIVNKVFENNYTPEERQKVMDQAKIVGMTTPQDETSSRGLIMRMLGQATEQVPNLVSMAASITPIGDIKKEIDKRYSEGKILPRTFGLFKGLSDWVGTSGNNHDPKAVYNEDGSLNEKETIKAINASGSDLPVWAETVLAGPEALTVEMGKYFAKQERANVYYNLDNIRGPNGEKMDDGTNRLISGALGAVMGGVLAYTNRFLAGKFLFGALFKKSGKDIIKKTATEGVLKIATNKALSSVLKTSGKEAAEIYGTMLGQSIFNNTIDIIGQNMAVEINDFNTHSKNFADGAIDTSQYIKMMKQTALQTALAATPFALLGVGFKHLTEKIKTDAETRTKVNKIIEETIQNAPDDAKTTDIVEEFKNNPIIQDLSDRGQKIASDRLRIQKELGVVPDGKPDITLDEFIAGKEQQIKNDFENQTGITIESPEYETELAKFRKENLNEYYPELDLTDKQLKKRYDQDVKNTEANVVYEDGKPRTFTFEQYKNQRRQLNAYYENWQRITDSQKYFSAMDPVADVIKRTLGEDIPEKTKQILSKHMEKINSLIENSKKGDKVQTVKDFNILTDLEVKELDKRITKLEEMGRENRKNRIYQSELGRKTRELIRTKYELQHGNYAISHIMESVAREIFNKHKIQRKLESIHQRLVEKIEFYDSKEYQDFINGKRSIRQTFDKMISDIKKTAEENKDSDLIELLDSKDDEYSFNKIVDSLVKDLEEREKSYATEHKTSKAETRRQVIDLLKKNTLKDLYNSAGRDLKGKIKSREQTLWDRAKQVKEIDNFKKMIIYKMRKSLSNYIKLYGNSYMESIMSPVRKNVSILAKEKIEAIQDAIKKVDSAVSQEDIDAAKKYVNEKLFPASKNSKLKFEPNYDLTSKKVSEILMRNLKITYDPNVQAIPPKLSLSQLIELKTAVDLMKFLGKVELSEAKKKNFVDLEAWKSSFLAHQKKIYEMSKKDRKLLKGLKFETMHPYYWSDKLFGDAGRKMFVEDKLEAQNNKEIEMRDRTRVLMKDLGLHEKNLSNIMFSERDINGVPYKVQELMFMYLAKNDNDIRTSLIYGNKILKELIGDKNTTGLAEEHLSPKEIKIAETLQKDLIDAYDRTAAVYEANTGNRMGFIDWYLPLAHEGKVFDVLEEDLFNTMFRGTDYEQSAVFKGHTMERSKVTPENATQIRMDTWGLWQDYLQKQEHYIAMSQWVSNSKRFMSDGKITSTINENFDKSWVNGINDYVNNIANPGTLYGTTVFDQIARGLKQNIATSALMYRSTIILRQIPSSVLYISEAGLGHYVGAHAQFTKAFYFKNGKFGNRITDFIREVDPYTAKSETEYKIMRYKEPKNNLAKAKRKFDDFGMSFISNIDLAVKSIGWKAVYDKYLPLLGRDGAIKKAREWTSVTQPSSDKTSLPGMYRKGEMMSLLTLFTQQPTKLLNYGMYSVIPDLVGKDGNRTAALIGLASLAVSNLAIYALTTKKMPEDPAEVTKALTIGALGWVPFVGKTVLRKSEGKRPVDSAQVARSTGQAMDILNYHKWKKAIGDKEKMASQLKKVNEFAGITLGFPSTAVNEWGKFLTDGDVRDIIIGGIPEEEK